MADRVSPARTDVAVVGGGPAGIAAAVRAAERGASVTIIDVAPHRGGQIWRHVPGGPVPARGARWLARLDRAPVQWRGETAVIDAGPGHLVLASRGATSRLEAAAIILATGARELFLPFPGWTLPNVVGVGAIQALRESGLSVRGRRVVLAGSGPLLLATAAGLATAGARVVRIAEQAPARALRGFATALWRTPAKLAVAARLRAAVARTPWHHGSWVLRAEGSERVERVTLTDGARCWTDACDLFGCAYGLVPNTELARLLGCETEADGIIVDAHQRTSVRGVWAAGECTGVAGEAAAIAEGGIAGLAASGAPEIAAPLIYARDQGAIFAKRLASAFALRAELRGIAADDTIVCRCEDVALGALRAGWSAREAKLYARVGMGPCQGRVCGAALEFLRGWESPSVRPPLTPVTVGALASQPWAATSGTGECGGAPRA